ncbi:MAG: PIN domain nuclease, partial [Thermocrispum sp.]
VAVCPVVELEFLFTARSVRDRSELASLLGTTFGWVAVPERAFDRAAEVQALLTERGTHRSAGMADLVIAATAELHGLTLVHYDRDFSQVAAVTGQRVAWVAPPGTVD